MPNTTDFSYDYQNQVRDLQEELAIISAAQPNFLSEVQISDTPCFQNKHEWPELNLQPERDTLNGAITNAVTTITVAHGSFFVADMQIGFDGYDEVMYVTGVSGNDLTVVRGYGGSTAVAMADVTKVLVISRPREENSNADPAASGKPAIGYNYTEIFDDTAQVSRTTQNTRLAGMANPLETAVMQSMLRIQRRMNMAAIMGRMQARDASHKGTMGGILQLITQRTNAAGAALTQTMINDGIEIIVTNGGSPNAILVNTNQARKISAFYANKLFVLRGDQVVGNSVSAFQSDLPGGVVERIIVDPNFPATKLALDPFQNSGLRDMDATLPGQDGYARRILGEYTFEVMNGGQAHLVIDNLLR